MNADVSKRSDVNQANGGDMRAVESSGANSISDDSKASDTKSNSDDDTKLAPAKLAVSVQVIMMASISIGLCLAQFGSVIT